MSNIPEEVVEGFLFVGEDNIKEAKKEAEGVSYVRGRISYNDPAKLLGVYKKMIDQNMFKTEVGISFLREIQDFLYSSDGINLSDIPPVPVAHHVIRTTEVVEKTEKDMVSKHKFALSVAGNVMLIVVVIIMFAIALSVDSPTILNYENEIINKYTQWEQELKERENALTLKEKDLEEMYTNQSN